MTKANLFDFMYIIISHIIDTQPKKISQFSVMKNQTVHIGEKIHNKVKEKGLTDAEFGRRINVTRQNAQNIYKRNSIDSEMLAKISNVLNFDFFNFYRLAEEQKIFNISKRPKIIFEIELNQEEIINLGLKEKINQILNS